jgi:aspartyl-tRNA(Asn)/glutamyl-tRNA(Gln) amidotransferase subunit C
MAKLSVSDVLKLAKLSKIQLTKDELDEFAQELSAILDYAEQLASVDTADLDPTIQVTGLTNVSRKDEVIDYGMTPEQLLRNAPAQQNGMIKVKRVIE